MAGGEEMKAEWFKPKDTVPDNDNEVLILGAFVSDTCFYNIGYYDGNDWRIGSGSFIDAPDYWAYLPEMPEEEE